jgi:hypothetical protein
VAVGGCAAVDLPSRVDIGTPERNVRRRSSGSEGLDCELVEDSPSAGVLGSLPFCGLGGDLSECTPPTTGGDGYGKATGKTSSAASPYGGGGPAVRGPVTPPGALAAARVGAAAVPVDVAEDFREGAVCLAEQRLALATA